MGIENVEADMDVEVASVLLDIGAGSVSVSIVIVHDILDSLTSGSTPGGR